MKNNDLQLRGVIVALVTPFDAASRVDEVALRQLVEFQIKSGVHGLNPCGTTGEHVLLSPAEREHVAEVVVNAADKRIPVFVQTGAAATELTIRLTRHARDIGATAATVVTPFYFRYGPSELIMHYVRVAQSVPDFPVYLYNIPQLTGNNLDPRLLVQVAEQCPNVMGLKDSSGNLQQIIETIQLLNGRFQIAIGADGLLLPSLTAGVSAAISGNANVFPELFVNLFEAYWRGDLAAAQAEQGRINAVRRVLRDGQDLSLFKAVLAQRGCPAGGVRAPLVDAPAEVVQSCIADLTALGLLDGAASSSLVHRAGV